MCGFAVIFKRENFTESDEAVLRNMSQAIRHRGPDEDRIQTTSRIGLAFRRLSIIDLELGSQPYTYLDRYTAVYNGEVYNYRELREELSKKGYEFSTDSEIEVMLAMYHDEGPTFIKKLRGMFAFVIYDAVANTLMGGRDPFGIKPFYYRSSESRFVASSEMKAFLFEPEIQSFDVDAEMLQHYLTYQYVPEPSTITPSVKILQAGHYFLCRDAGEISPLKYVDNKLKPTDESYEIKLQRVRNAVESSVKHHMISDVSVGTFLSSGVDSAIITAIASELSPGIKAFTVEFVDDDLGEINNAADIASHLNVEHITVSATPKDFMDAYESVIYHLDSPVADPSTVAIYIISREAAKHVKVILSGEGSDEFFGGYKSYRSGLITQKYVCLPKFITKLVSILVRIIPDGVRGKRFLKRIATPLNKRYVGNAFIFDEHQKQDLLVSFNKTQHFSSLTSDVFEGVSKLSHPAQMQSCDISMWLKGDILTKGDRLSMAHSLEARVPYVDREVFEAARSLNDKDKFKGGTTKHILRDAFKDILDSETVVRPKLGYPVPVRKWLKKELFEWAKTIIETSTVDKYVNKEAALRLLVDHQTGKSDNYREIWVILVFMTWHKIHVEQKEQTKQKILKGLI
jgi:asparagine synthase (glutamine-hydrolysing)